MEQAFGAELMGLDREALAKMVLGSKREAPAPPVQSFEEAQLLFDELQPTWPTETEESDSEKSDSKATDATDGAGAHKRKHPDGSTSHESAKSAKLSEAANGQAWWETAKRMADDPKLRVQDEELRALEEALMHQKKF